MAGTYLPRSMRFLVYSLCMCLFITLSGTSCPPSNLDSDGDGYTDAEEDGSFPGSDPNDATDTQAAPRDTDEDGCSDYDETVYDFCNGDPDVGGGLDSDGDGDPDDVEHFSTPGSDPNDATDTQANPRNSDGDECSDYDETEFNLCDANPNTP